jgi:ABC-type nitrate/sulfonate/bicarbonate transport system permease component
MSSAAAPRRRLNGPGLATMALGVGVWEALVRSGAIDFENLPAPSAIAGGAWDLMASGDLPGDIAHTLRSTLVGWLVASVAGVAVGTLLGLSRTAWRWSMASIEVVRAIPPVSLVPVALLAFGFALRTELSIIVYAATWTVLVSTIDGVRGVRPELLDVARVMRLSRAATVRKIVLPAAMPSVVVGLRLALSLSLVLAVVAEMLGNPSGLGNALVRAQQALQPEQMFAYVFTIGSLGVALNALFRSVSAWVMPSLTDGPARA